MIDESPAYPTLSVDLQFLQGVEFGLLLAKMQASDEPIEQFFTRGNQEQVLYLANRMGWSVETIHPQTPAWFWCRMTKARE